MRRLLVSFVVVCSSFVVGVRASSADLLVFKTGRTMSVQSYRVDGEFGIALLRAESRFRQPW
ncbi:MAG: hypothetical protein EXQ54_06460 [Acidobacteria bacterium]|nr:hypothetical protein [Acidobacteriota bacterium]